jgi:WD40 repeat protein
LILPSCFSADGRWLAGAEMVNGQWLGGIWSLKTGNRRLALPELARDRYLTGNAAFSPDNSTLAYENVRHGIDLCHLATARTCSLPGHSRPIFALLFSPNGRWLASASWDATARVWDVASGQPVTPWLVGHRSGVEWLHFTADGRTLVTGCIHDHAIRFWHLPTGTEVLRSRYYPPALDRVFASDDSVLMEGIPSLTNAFQWTPLPALDQIDTQIKMKALIPAGRVVP